MVMMDSPIDYENLVRQLIELVPDILAVAFVEGNNNIVYSTNNWDISSEISNISAGWSMLKLPSVNISGGKYITLQLEVDSLVATSVSGDGHIVGFKDDERKIITYVTPEGDRKAAIVELSRMLSSIGSQTPYISEDVKLTAKYNLDESALKTSIVDPQLESDIKTFLAWLKDENGMQGYLNYYLQKNDEKVLTQLAKIYSEFREVFGV